MLTIQPYYALVILEHTAVATSECVDEMVSWDKSNGILFDPKKAEVMHFPQARLQVSPSIYHRETEKRPKAAMRCFWPETYGRKARTAT
jgi:hypothetical protein